MQGAAARPIGFYVWRGHWLQLVRRADGRLAVLMPTADVDRFKADIKAGRVRIDH